MGRHSPRQHKIAGSPPCPPQQGLCVWWKARPAWEDLLHLICAKRGYTCFAGGGRGWGWGGGAVIYFFGTSRAPPCVIWWPGVSVCQHTTSRVSRGWEEGAVGRRHEGTEFWGTNPRRNSLREPTCVQGGQKKTSPCTWENTPPREKAHLRVGVPTEGRKHPPPVVQRPRSGEDKGPLCSGETHCREKTHVHLMLVHV